MRQRTQFVVTPDGVRLAWARCGTGPVLVRAATWLTHLQYDWESPLWGHWLHFLTDHFSVIRYDERGCGLSDRATDKLDLTDAHWTPDLELVVDAADVRRPMYLLGVSQGAVTAIRYAVRHPERVAGLILYGGFARGLALQGDFVARRYAAVLEMMRLGWGSANSAFRQAFTTHFVPGATHEQLDWFNELCRRTASPEVAVRLLEARGGVDVSALLSQVRVPTLVMHARHDAVIPFSEGQALASGIPGAHFVELDSRNHILLHDEPAWPAFRQAILDFSGLRPKEANGPDLTALTRRQRQILDLLAEGMSNAEIGRRLFISEKTVRNHLSAVYDRLGVRSRMQAVVVAGRLGATPPGA